MTKKKPTVSSPVPITRTCHFRCALGIPLLLIAFFVGVICWSEPLVPDMSAKGLNNFVELFKVPIALAGGMLVLVGLSVSYHRGGISLDQLNSQLEQNAALAFRESRNDFYRHFDSLDQKFSVLNIPISNLFETLYPKSRDRDMTIEPMIEAYFGKGVVIPGSSKYDTPWSWKKQMSVLAKALLERGFGGLEAEALSAECQRLWGQLYELRFNPDFPLAFQNAEPDDPEHLRQIRAMIKDYIFLHRLIITFERSSKQGMDQLGLWDSRFDVLEKAIDELERMKKFTSSANWQAFYKCMVAGAQPGRSLIEQLRLDASQTLGENSQDLREYIRFRWDNEDPARRSAINEALGLQ